MADGDKSNSAIKASGNVIAVIAIIGTSSGIIAAIISPMQLTVEDLKDDVEKHSNWVGEHDRRIEARDAAQWERIKSLERVIFGKAESVTIAPGDEP